MWSYLTSRSLGLLHKGGMADDRRMDVYSHGAIFDDRCLYSGCGSWRVVCIQNTTNKRRYWLMAMTIVQAICLQNIAGHGFPVSPLGSNKLFFQVCCTMSNRP